MKMFKEDLFKDLNGVIAHGVNAQGAMGSGVAKIIRDRFPVAYEMYMEHCRNSKRDGHYMLGDCQIVEINKNLVIANCFTQDYYGRTGGPYADLNAIRQSLTTAAEWAKLHNMELKMPKIGAGLGGLQWNQVAEVVSQIEEDVGIVISVYYIEG